MGGIKVMRIQVYPKAAAEDLQYHNVAVTIIILANLTQKFSYSDSYRITIGIIINKIQRGTIKDPFAFISRIANADTNRKTSSISLSPSTLPTTIPNTNPMTSLLKPQSSRSPYYKDIGTNNVANIVTINMAEK